MVLKIESPAVVRLDQTIVTALTFDDVLLVPQHSQVRADAGGRVHPLLTQHPPERAARQRGDGHRHRVAAGDRDGAARRDRRDPQEHVDRGAGLRGRPGEALRERHDRQPGHALAARAHLRGARADEEVPDLRRADHRGRLEGRAARRHPDQPRPAVRDQRAAADRGGHDEGAPGHGARSARRSRRRARSCTSTRSRSCSSSIRRSG